MKPRNIEEPVIEVEFFLLERSPHHVYRSDCPTCLEGILMVGRDRETLEVQEYDMCILCGQRFRYTDIEKMRDMERV